MSFTHKIDRILTTGGVQASNLTESITAASQTRVLETIATGQTNKLVNYTLVVANCKSFMVVASVAMTFKTNSSSTPLNTLNLLAGVPYYWSINSLDTFKLTGDVTALYLTNASGTDGTLTLESLFDPTP